MLRSGANWINISDWTDGDAQVEGSIIYVRLSGCRVDNTDLYYRQ